MPKPTAIELEIEFAYLCEIYDRILCTSLSAGYTPLGLVLPKTHRQWHHANKHAREARLKINLLAKAAGISNSAMLDARLQVICLTWDEIKNETENRKRGI